MKKHPSRIKRTAAFCFDEVFAASVLALLGSVIPIAGSALAVALYYIAQDSLMGAGISPGRKLFGQRLAGLEGERITHTRAAARNCARLIVWLTVVGLIADLVTMITTGRSIADYLLDTRV
ncbi:unnamed protein product, partial [Laminaria digitata]